MQDVDETQLAKVIREKEDLQMLLNKFERHMAEVGERRRTHLHRPTFPRLDSRQYQSVDQRTRQSEHSLRTSALRRITLLNPLSDFRPRRNCRELVMIFCKTHRHRKSLSLPSRFSAKWNTHATPVRFSPHSSMITFFLQPSSKLARSPTNAIPSASVFEYWFVFSLFSNWLLSTSDRYGHRPERTSEIRTTHWRSGSGTTQSMTLSVRIFNNRLFSARSRSRRDHRTEASSAWTDQTLRRANPRAIVHHRSVQSGIKRPEEHFGQTSLSLWRSRRSGAEESTAIELQTRRTSLAGREDSSFGEEDL